MPESRDSGGGELCVVTRRSCWRHDMRRRSEPHRQRVEPEGVGETVEPHGKEMKELAASEGPPCYGGVDPMLVRGASSIRGAEERENAGCRRNLGGGVVKSEPSGEGVGSFTTMEKALFRHVGGMVMTRSDTAARAWWSGTLFPAQEQQRELSFGAKHNLFSWTTS